MFHRKNPEAFWGFGIVMGRRAAEKDAEANLNASIKYIQMANDIDPNNGKIIGDLAFSHALLGKELSSKGADAAGQYAKAELLFREAYRLEPKHPPIVANWAALNFYAGNYPEAKRLLDKAIELGYKPDPEDVREIWDKVK
jgi:tetratricopeptide (TPR) repeat protein